MIASLCSKEALASAWASGGDEPMTEPPNSTQLERCELRTANPGTHKCQSNNTDEEKLTSRKNLGSSSRVFPLGIIGWGRSLLLSRLRTKVNIVIAWYGFLNMNHVPLYDSNCLGCHSRFQMNLKNSSWTLPTCLNSFSNELIPKGKNNPETKLHGLSLNLYRPNCLN